MPEYVTRARAAAILGVSTNTVDRLIGRGVLTPRADLTWRGGKPSLDPSQVRRVAEQRSVDQIDAKYLRREREQAQAARRVSPPDTEHEWLTASKAARVMGVTEQAVFKRSRLGTIPFEVSAGRRWYRKNLIEALSRSRQAGFTRDVQSFGH